MSALGELVHGLIGQWQTWDFLGGLCVCNSLCACSHFTGPVPDVLLLSLEHSSMKLSSEWAFPCVLRIHTSPLEQGDDDLLAVTGHLHSSSHHIYRLSQSN